MNQLHRDMAVLQLKHLQLELSSPVQNNMRTYIDFWFCYTNGYVTKGNKPNWGALWGDGIISAEVIEAAKVSELSGADRTKKVREVMSNKFTGDNTVTRDHSIPVDVIVKKLQSLVNPSLDDIEAVLIKFVHQVTITRTEDKKLNDAGLNRIMPEEFYNPEHILFENVYARYIKAGIIIPEVHKELYN